jgi:hypothetical protein
MKITTQIVEKDTIIMASDRLYFQGISSRSATDLKGGDLASSNRSRGDFGGC